MLGPRLLSLLRTAGCHRFLLPAQTVDSHPVRNNRETIKRQIQERKCKEE